MSQINVTRLREIAEVEFADIVVETFLPGVNEFRIILTDGSFVDVWFSLTLRVADRYSFHFIPMSSLDLAPADLEAINVVLRTRMPPMLVAR